MKRWKTTELVKTVKGEDSQKAMGNLWAILSVAMKKSLNKSAFPRQIREIQSSITPSLHWVESTWEPLRNSTKSKEDTVIWQDSAKMWIGQKRGCLESLRTSPMRWGGYQIWHFIFLFFRKIWVNNIVWKKLAFLS